MEWRYNHTALALCTLAFFGTMVARLAISPVVPDITDQFGVTNGMVGLALSGMWAGYALTQFPSGVIGDRVGYRTVMLVALAGTGAASLGLVVATSFPLFLVFAVVLGIATGLHYSPATAFLTQRFENTGRAIGVHVTGGPIAGLLAPIAAAFLGARFGWRVAVALGAIVAIPTFVAFLSAIRPTEPTHPERSVRTRFEFATLAELLSRPEITYTIALSIVGAFAWQATASFFPAFLESYHGFSGTTAGLLFAGYFLVHGVTQPVIGDVSDRLSREPVVFIVWGIGIVGYASLILADSMAVVVFGVTCVGIAMGWGAPLQSRFMDVLAEDEQGMGFGLVRTTYMTVGATGSLVVGGVSDVLGWSVAFGILGGLLTLGILAIGVNRIGGGRR